MFDLLCQNLTPNIMKIQVRQSLMTDVNFLRHRCFNPYCEHWFHKTGQSSLRKNILNSYSYLHGIGLIIPASAYIFAHFCM